MYTINSPKHYRLREYKINVEYSYKNYLIIKKKVKNNDYDSYEWGFIWKDDWLYFYRIVMQGFLIKIKFEKSEEKIFIKKIMVYPNIFKDLLGNYSKDMAVEKDIHIWIADIMSDIFLKK